MTKLLTLISEGIDSPVAAYKMDKFTVDFIHFDIDSNIDNVVEIIKSFTKDRKLFVVSFGPVLKEIVEKIPENLRCVACKRMMYRIANKVANENNHRALVTGDNLGQVASQTLENLRCITEASELPIIRPLLSMDKQQTIKIAKEIGTYKRASTKSCPIVPKKPRTACTLDEIYTAEKKLDIINLSDDAAADIQKINL